MKKKKSIRRKFSFIIVGISILTLIVGMVIVMVVTIKDLRKNLEDTSVKNAELLATHSAAPLIFQDNKKAKEVLERLTLIPAIHKAVIYTQDHKVFQEYHKDSTLNIKSLRISEYYNEYHDFYLYVYRPIVHKEHLVGYIYLVVSTEDMEKKIEDTAYIFLLILLIMIVAAYFLSSILQRSVTRPIISLADTMAEVTQNEDYSVRVEVGEKNEIGTLYSCFNNMLGKIESTSKELRNSEERFRAIYNSANDAIFVHELVDGKIIDVNETTLEMYGILDKSGIIGRDASGISSNNNSYKVANLNKMFEQVYSTGQPVIVEWQARKQSGQFFWVELNIDMVTLLGKPRILVISRDINDRKKAEEEMILAKKYVDNIINSMPSIIAGVDAKGIITHWNLEAETRTGLHHDKAIGMEITDLLPSIIPDFKDIILSIKNQSVYSTNKSTKLEDGSSKYEHISVYPLLTEYFTGAVIRIDDITEQNRLQEMVVQSEKMLSVGGLAAGMAHEINNPLAGIMASIEVIRLRLLDKPRNKELAKQVGVDLELIRQFFEISKINKKIDMMHELVKRASKIVQDMLDFSRQDDALKKHGNLIDTVEKTLELASQDYNLKKKYDFRKIKLKKNYDTDLPRILYHESRVQQVFLNILKNGAEAMDEHNNKGFYSNGNKPEFNIHISDIGDFIQVKIADNGPGIDQVTVSRIFEPFFTTKEVGVGTGLGLSVSYFIITEHHKGNLRVESEPGNGAIFVVELPKKSDPS